MSMTDVSTRQSRASVVLIMTRLHGGGEIIWPELAYSRGYYRLARGD
jgi:hypothetical protein